MTAITILAYAVLGLAALLLVLLLLSVAVYIVVRSATLAFYRARKLARQLKHQRNQSYEEVQ